MCVCIKSAVLVFTPSASHAERFSIISRGFRCTCMQKTLYTVPTAIWRVSTFSFSFYLRCFFYSPLNSPIYNLSFFSFDIGCAFFPFRGYVYGCMDDYIHISTYILLLPFHFLLPSSSLFFFRRAQIRDGSTRRIVREKQHKKFKRFYFFLFFFHTAIRHSLDRFLFSNVFQLIRREQ